MYSVDVQITRTKDFKSPHDRDNINFTYNVVYFIMCWLYLCIILLCLIMYIFQLLCILIYNILHGINIFNGKMGKPNAYLYENWRTTYRKITSRE